MDSDRSAAPVPEGTVVFRLTVQPMSASRPWHAQLARLAEETTAPPLEFESPIELLRHLAQLGHGDDEPPPGGLK